MLALLDPEPPAFPYGQQPQPLNDLFLFHVCDWLQFFPRHGRLLVFVLVLLTSVPVLFRDAPFQRRVPCVTPQALAVILLRPLLQAQPSAESALLYKDVLSLHAPDALPLPLLETKLHDARVVRLATLLLFLQ